MVDPIMAAHAGDLILKLKRAYQKTAIVVTHDTHLQKTGGRGRFSARGPSKIFWVWRDFETSEDPILRIFRLETS